MKHITVTLVAILIFILSGLVTAVQAGPPLPEVDSVDIVADCGGATVTYSHSFGMTSEVRITNLDTGITITDDGLSSSSGTLTFTFNPGLADGTRIEVDIRIFGVFSNFPSDSQVTWQDKNSIQKQSSEIEGVGGGFLVATSSRIVTVMCGEQPRTSTNIESIFQICDDGRVNINLCEPIAIYPIFDVDGVHMVIYNVERGDDIGEFALYLDADDLSLVPYNSNQAIELGRSRDNFVVVYWLPSNEYQINAGPDHEGKVFVYRFSTFPQLPTVSTFYAPDTTVR